MIRPARKADIFADLRRFDHGVFSPCVDLRFASAARYKKIKTGYGFFLGKGIVWRCRMCSKSDRQSETAALQEKLWSLSKEAVLEITEQYSMTALTPIALAAEPGLQQPKPMPNPHGLHVFRE